MPVSLCHLVLSSRVITAPPSYCRVMTVKPNGVKNSAGGAEPESSSPMTGLRRNRNRAGGILGFNVYWSLVVLFYFFYWLGDFIPLGCDLCRLIFRQVFDGLRI